MSPQLSEISKLLYALNDRVGQPQDRDCSETSAPLQSHHDDSDGSESDSANRTELEAGSPSSTSDFPKFDLSDLSEGSELDNDEDACKDNVANFFVSDDK